MTRQDKKDLFYLRLLLANNPSKEGLESIKKILSTSSSLVRETITKEFGDITRTRTKVKVIVEQSVLLREYTPEDVDIWVVEYDPDVEKDPQTTSSKAIINMKMIAYAIPNRETCYSAYPKALNRAHKLAARIEAANEEGRQLSGCPACKHLVVRMDKRPYCDCLVKSTPLQSLDWNKGEVSCPKHENKEGGE